MDHQNLFFSLLSLRASVKKPEHLRSVTGLHCIEILCYWKFFVVLHSLLDFPCKMSLQLLSSSRGQMFSAGVNGVERFDAVA